MMFDEAPEGAEYVIPSYRDRGKNLRTRLERIRSELPALANRRLR